MRVLFHLEHAAPLEGAEDSDQNLETAKDDFYQDILEPLEKPIPLKIVKRYDDGSADCRMDVPAELWPRVHRRLDNHSTVQGEGKEITLEFYGGYVARDFQW